MDPLDPDPEPQHCFSQQFLFAFAEIVDRELNDEELDKVGSKEAIRRELASRIADAVTEEAEMKRTSNTSSAQEGTRTKAEEDDILHIFLPLYSLILFALIDLRYLLVTWLVESSSQFLYGSLSQL